jgi:MoxR-like ATPase
VLSYDALADNISADTIVDRVLKAVPPPTVAPRQSATPGPTDHMTLPSTPPSSPPALPAWPRA